MSCHSDSQSRPMSARLTQLQSPRWPNVSVWC
ncbi:hypothetical protein [Haloarcula sp. H-GB4]